MDIGFPELTPSFLAGQDILYAQFNDIDFFVEDISQEHFYFNVLKTIFPTMKFEKIFPLDGKKNVVAQAKLHPLNKKKIFIVDLDFDGILGLKENISNLFYLEKYSIENHLISKKALVEFIRSEKYHTSKDDEIEKMLNYDDLIKSCTSCLKELACHFIIIQKYQLGLDYYSFEINKDFDFTIPNPSYRQNFITDYFAKVETALKLKNKRLVLKTQISKFNKFFNNLVKSLKNIPGKYMLLFIKEMLQKKHLIPKITVEKFTYNLGKNIDINEISYLKNNIETYLKS